jgi:hypothetical protein
VDGIVVVARIDGIDGEEIERGEIGAAGKLRRLELPHLGQHGMRELVGDAVRVHGDQADLALILRVAERLGDPGLRHSEAVRAVELEAHEIAGLGAAFIAGRDRPFPKLLAIDGVDEPAASRLGAEDAEQASLLARQALDRLGLVAVAEDVGILEPGQPRQDAVALPERGARPSRARRAGPAPGRGGARPRPYPRRRARRSARRPCRGRRSRSTATGAAVPRSLKLLRLPLSRPSSAISASRS